MKISHKWLSEWVPSPPPDELAERLTLAGLEVEGIERLGAGLEGVVVAQIKASDPHPQADKLSVTRVDAGGPELLQIVCGAKNYKVGDKVPLAKIGAKLPGGLEIKKASLRGVESFGMLCSERELGLSDEAAGLMILDRALLPGTGIARALGIDDAVLEVNVTPNRPDALSHRGVAREVAALTRATLAPLAPTFAEEAETSASRVKVRIEDPRKCVRYMARVVVDVTVAPSPAWLAQRLRACGVRSINNVVDVTNLVLLELGQPLHAFDLDRVSGREIVVRVARPDEKLTTLDGKERVLSPDDLLICDGARPQVLAGVMGGADSEVSAKTKNVLLEAATFEPATVRRSAKRHQLHTESSHRFERGADVNVLPQAIDRAAALLAELAGGKILAGRVDAYPSPAPARIVTLRKGRVGAVLGTPVAWEETRQILVALGFLLENETEEAGAWKVPSFRVDVEREEDLIEEVARVRGYHTIPAAVPKSGVQVTALPPEVEVERRARAALIGAGFDEILSYSFVSPRELEVLGAPREIRLENPLSVEQSVMRSLMAPGLLSCCARAFRHQAEWVRAFELGRVYRAADHPAGIKAPPARESHVLGGVLAGRRATRSWTAKEEGVDFFDAKGAVEAVLSALGIASATFEPAEVPHLHPAQTANVSVNGRLLGTLGKVHPRVLKGFDLGKEAFLFELDVAALAQAAALLPQYRELPRFPAVLRDLAVVVDLALTASGVCEVILAAGGSMLEDVTLFDVYQGKPIPEGKKNLAFGLRYRAPDRTLTDAEANEVHARIVEDVNRRLGGLLRA